MGGGGQGGRSVRRGGPENETRADGRTLRTVRTRAALLADRAGVSLRSLFGHFPTVDALHLAACADWVGRLAQPAPRCDGPLEARIAVFVSDCADRHEAALPLWRTIDAARARSEGFRALDAEIRGAARRRLAAAFAAELAAVPRAMRTPLTDAIEVLCDRPAWDRLRAGLGRTPAQARSVLRAGLARLLAP